MGTKSASDGQVFSTRTFSGGSKMRAIPRTAAMDCPTKPASHKPEAQAKELPSLALQACKVLSRGCSHEKPIVGDQVMLAQAAGFSTVAVTV
jgi:hypothetical protein